MEVTMEDIEESRRKRQERKAELKKERKKPEARKLKPIKLLPQVQMAEAMAMLFKKIDKIRWEAGLPYMIGMTSMWQMGTTILKKNE